MARIRPGRPKGSTTGSVWQRAGDPAWIAEWIYYDASGNRKKRQIVVGRHPEMDREQAILAMNRAMREHLLGIGLLRFVGQVSRSTAYDERVSRGLKEYHSGQRGAAAELTVSIDLMSQGFDVFRPFNPQACCDLIAVRQDDMIRLEVKSGDRDEKGRIRVDVRRNIGKFDLLAVVLRDGTILYQPHSEIVDGLYPFWDPKVGGGPTRGPARGLNRLKDRSVVENKDTCSTT